MRIDNRTLDQLRSTRIHPQFLLHPEGSVLVEAGQIAVRRDQELARVYKRVLVRRGHAKAKVAIGRRLLVRAFIMLRDEIDYAEFQRRGVAARSSREIA